MRKILLDPSEMIIPDSWIILQKDDDFRLLYYIQKDECCGISDTMNVQENVQQYDNYYVGTYLGNPTYLLLNTNRGICGEMLTSFTYYNDDGYELSKQFLPVE